MAYHVLLQITELTTVCDTHLVNKGVIMDGMNLTISVQPTGPSFDARVTDLQCRCNPVEPDFTPCKLHDFASSLQ